jgi:hypothetical protein
VGVAGALRIGGARRGSGFQSLGSEFARTMNSRSQCDWGDRPAERDTAHAAARGKAAADPRGGPKLEAIRRNGFSQQSED